MRDINSMSMGNALAPNRRNDFGPAKRSGPRLLSTIPLGINRGINLGVGRLNRRQKQLGHHFSTAPQGIGVSLANYINIDHSIAKKCSNSGSLGVNYTSSSRRNGSVSFEYSLAGKVPEAAN